MTRPAPINLQVLGSSRLTPNMHRVTLGGDALQDFPAGRQGGYLKLRLPVQGKTIVRTYTIRNHRPGELDVDFALHGSAELSGPATRWALEAQEGDSILVGGPGPAKPLPEGDGPFLLVGDMTALPAIAVNLEALPQNARGHAIVEIQSNEDMQDIALPPGFSLHWQVNPAPGTKPDLLHRCVRDLEWAEPIAYAWSASEFEAMRLLRPCFRDDFGLGPDRLYISSYWKHGLTEEGHRMAKQANANA